MGIRPHREPTLDPRFTPRRLPIKVRYGHQEPLDRYIERLFVRNHLTAGDAREAVHQVTSALTGDPLFSDRREAELVVAREYGWFRPVQARSSARAAHELENLLSHRGLRGDSRWMCIQCAHGETIQQLPRSGPNVCRRHHRWVGPNATPERQVRVPLDVWHADRSLRRKVRAGVWIWHQLEAVFHAVEKLQPAVSAPESWIVTEAIAFYLQELRTQLDVHESHPRFARVYSQLYAMLAAVGFSNPGEAADRIWLFVRPDLLRLHEKEKAAETIAPPEAVYRDFLAAMGRCAHDPWHDYLVKRSMEPGTGLPISPSSPPANVLHICDYGHVSQRPLRHVKKSYDNGTSGCAVCHGRTAIIGLNTLRDTHPELASEFEPSLNGGRDPDDIHGRSRTPFQWRCSEGHVFEMTILSRANGGQCPTCHPSHQRKLSNDAYEWLWDEWSDRNIGRTLHDVSPNDTAENYWHCSLGHEYLASPSNRVYNRTGCPFCASRRLLPGFNDLATKAADIAAEWDYTANGTARPEYVFPGCHDLAHWKCSKGHRFAARIVDRTSGGSGCPRCAGRQLVFSDFDEWMALWDVERNRGLDPAELSATSTEPVHLICGLGHRFQRSPAQLRRGRRCTNCPGGRQLSA